VDLSLRTVEKPPLDLLVYVLEAVFESEDLCGELGDDAGSERLGRQGDALRLGGTESPGGDAVESLDAVFSEVGGDALVSRPPESRGALVAVRRVRGPLLFRSNIRSKAGESDNSASPRRAMVLFWSTRRSRRPSRMRSWATSSSPGSSSSRSDLIRA
jgi:hypothetical protein